MEKVDDFLEKLKAIYPKDYKKVFKSHYVNKPKTFRVNYLKANKEDVLKNLKKEGFIIEESEVPDGYVVKNNKRLSDSIEFQEGNIHIQGLSSMLAPIILNPESKEKILDLCAAPGSKTSQIASMTNNKAEIIAVEENKTRFLRFKDILKHKGVKAEVYLADGVRFPFKYPKFINYFDKVLVDAPCTSEAEINLKDLIGLKFWRTSNASRLSKLQKGLLNSAIKMLKPGGILVYSTCTYSVEENELVLNWILKRYPELKIKEIDLPIKNIQQGRVEWKGKVLNEQIKNSVRIIPNEYFNGFFVARIVKQ